MAQYANPSADITDGTWLNASASATDIYLSLVPAVNGSIDSSDDATYAESVAAPSAAPYACHLTDPTDPAVSTGHIMRWRRGKDAAGGADINLTVQLREGYTGEGALGTEIKSNADNTIPDAFANATPITLSAGEADSIMDYTDLQLRILASQV